MDTYTTVCRMSVWAGRRHIRSYFCMRILMYALARQCGFNLYTEYGAPVAPLLATRRS